MDAETTELPYTDTKPVGAADFYTAINATFRFIEQRHGMEGLRRYWRELGTDYYRPVTERWQEGGMKAVADYWTAFFKAEPGAEAKVSASEKDVTVDVQRCPVIAHLRKANREIVSYFCQHCYYVSAAMGEDAGITVRVAGGNGQCVQRFIKEEPTLAEQNLEDIAKAS
jgi:hypothetical protein